ncbi:unnamed protein product [Cyprideis torosa]|uniref:Uncharacterized protein n=1 Tax=Cyprideis torosa TaxID=163714 RepID=A0A7R8WJ14_9CRUS|nr:unnamed protein product [Cyprideis torosa]CAG0895131.1 unnamed protein product [Cyprideis torosa]
MPITHLITTPAKGLKVGSVGGGKSGKGRGKWGKKGKGAGVNLTQTGGDARGLFQGQEGSSSVGSDGASEPPALSLKPGQKITVEALRVATYIDVLWQDGTESIAVPSSDLYPGYTIDEHEFFPGTRVLMETSNSDAVNAPQKGMDGIVQWASQADRTAMIRWVPADRPGDAEEDDELSQLIEKEHAVYELKLDVYLHYRIGDIVLLLRGGGIIPKCYVLDVRSEMKKLEEQFSPSVSKSCQKGDSDEVDSTGVVISTLSALVEQLKTFRRETVSLNGVENLTKVESEKISLKRRIQELSSRIVKENAELESKIESERQNLKRRFQELSSRIQKETWSKFLITMASFPIRPWISQDDDSNSSVTTSEGDGDRKDEDDEWETESEHSWMGDAPPSTPVMCQASGERVKMPLTADYLSVQSLKEILSDEELPTDGSREVLLQRLQQHLLSTHTTLQALLAKVPGAVDPPVEEALPQAHAFFTLPPPPMFDMQDFMNYIEASGAVSISEKQKIAMLLHCGGAEFQRTVRSLNVEFQTLEEAVKHISKKFTPIDSTLISRYRLGETAMNPALARALEASSAQQDEMINSSPAVLQISDKSRKKSSKKSFKTPNSSTPSNSFKKEIPMLTHPCKYCGTIHLRSLAHCPKRDDVKLKSWKSSTAHQVKSTSEDNVSDDLLTYNFQVGKPQIFGTLVVEGVPRKFQLDTGATKDFIPCSFLKGRFTLKKCPPVRVFGDTLVQPLGVAQLNVSLPGQPSAVRPFVVMPKGEVALLGLKSCTEFKFLSLNNELVYHVTAEEDIIHRVNTIINAHADVFGQDNPGIKGVQAHIAVKADAEIVPAHSAIICDGRDC